MLLFWEERKGIWERRSRGYRVVYLCRRDAETPSTDSNPFWAKEAEQNHSIGVLKFETSAKIFEKEFRRTGSWYICAEKRQNNMPFFHRCFGQRNRHRNFILCFEKGAKIFEKELQRTERWCICAEGRQKHHRQLRIHFEQRNQSSRHTPLRNDIWERRPENREMIYIYMRRREAGTTWAHINPYFRQRTRHVEVLWLFWRKKSSHSSHKFPYSCLLASRESKHIDHQDFKFWTRGGIFWEISRGESRAGTSHKVNVWYSGRQREDHMLRRTS